MRDEKRVLLISFINESVRSRNSGHVYNFKWMDDLTAILMHVKIRIVHSLKRICVRQYPSLGKILRKQLTNV